MMLEVQFRAEADHQHLHYHIGENGTPTSYLSSMRPSGVICISTKRGVGEVADQRFD